MVGFGISSLSNFGTYAVIIMIGEAVFLCIIFTRRKVKVLIKKYQKWVVNKKGRRLLDR